MRIIAGELKGRKILSPEFEGVRPTSDMVRESIFNIAQTYIYGAAVLDLFAGSGAMGIEAISRGAKSAVFADKDRRAVALVKKNLESLKIENAEVINADFKRASDMLFGRKFDIIFLDPPYDFKETPQIFENIFALLADGGRVIYEFSERGGLAETPAGYAVEKEKRYGKTGVLVLRRNFQSEEASW